MSQRVVLKAVAGPGKGAEFSASEPSVCIIGRSDDCNIIITGDSEVVSKHHCLVDINPPILTIEDLGSKYGTLLNGNELTRSDKPSLLHDGDRILIGSNLFMVAVEGFIPEAISTLPESSPSADTAQTGESHTVTVTPLKEIGGYDILSVLGHGGGGIVYLAEDQETKRQVALKTMLPEIAVDVEHKARFIRESKSMEILSHKNIVPILGAGVSNGLFYFTLEYCNGGNLTEMVKESPSPISYRKAVGITIQILRGLDYLHNIEIPDVQLDDGAIGTARGLIHRDIKPENILIDMVAGEPVAKISDFGLAKAFNLAGMRGLTQTGAVAGTLEFVCRQQVINYKYAKPEVDVWSSAAVLYFLLSGRAPRTFYKIKHSLCALLESDPVSLEKRRPDLPAGLIELVDFALDDRVELAYKTAKSLSEDLTKYAD